MNVFDKSLSPSAQDPSGNPSWEGSSCLREAPQERQGFTNRHLSLPIPCRVLPRAMCSGKLQTGLLVAGYFVYLLVGAAVFQALERTAEKQQKMAAAQMKEAFLQNFPHLTVAEMEQFMKNLTEAIQNGVYPVGNESQTENSNWDFSNSFFFAGTVVSTIGKQPGRIYFSYYRTLVAIWILFGLAWIALLFNLLTTVLEDTEKIIVKDLHQIVKVSKDNEASQPRRCWPAHFLPEEEVIPPCAGGDAQKMESLASGSEQTKK
nr:potassium channel subfamily K member 10-like isoform X4 [Anser cygnoides]